MHQYFWNNIKWNRKMWMILSCSICFCYLSLSWSGEDSIIGCYGHHDKYFLCSVKTKSLTTWATLSYSVSVLYHRNSLVTVKISVLWDEIVSAKLHRIISLKIAFIMFSSLRIENLKCSSVPSSKYN
jgi:hypothetical protein